MEAGSTSVPLDLNLLPVARSAGQEYPELMGLYLAEPPRHPARGRSADRLILYLAMTGNAPLPPGKQELALESLAKVFYATPGSVTAAMRAVADELNTVLWKRNLRIASSGQQGLGLLTQLVLREQQLYLAQSGPLHAFLITAGETQQFHDPEMVGRSLGQGRALPIAYFQANIQPNDTLILAAQPAPDWNTTTLSGLHGQGPESLRRRLFGQEILDLNSVLIQARSGKGKSFLLRSKTSSTAGPATETARTETTGQLPSAEPVFPQIEGVPVQIVEEVGAEAGLPAAETLVPLSSQPSVSSLESGAVVSQPATVGDQASEPAQAQPSTAPSRSKFSLASMWNILVLLGTPLARVLYRVGAAGRTLLARMLPNDPFQGISNSVLAGIAVAVPLIIVSMAWVAYNQLGRTAQYQVLYAQAEQRAVQAVSRSNLLEKRSDLESALELLLQAEERAPDAQSRAQAEALRVQVSSALDELDLIRRVNYQPAVVGGLPVSANITRLVTSDSDLYMLDSSNGSVMHAELTSQGYVVDYSFQCGADASGNSQTGPLIDIMLWPAGYQPAANVVAMDASGNVLYCRSNKSPELERMTSPANSALGNLVGFSLDLGDTYVLDPLSNAVWIYWKSTLSEEPQLFFDQQIPFMQDMVDLVANNGELYLLHADGRMTFCFFSGMGVAPTRCSDATYIDFRLGRENMPLTPPYPFTQIMFTSPPDPSLYLFEPKSQAIFHFSLRNLAFQRQYLPLAASKLPARDATAFTVSPIRRMLFLAIGNQVYYAVMP